MCVLSNFMLATYFAKVIHHITTFSCKFELFLHVCAHSQPAMCAHSQPAMCAHSQPAMCAHSQPAMCAHSQPAMCAHSQPAMRVACHAN